MKIGVISDTHVDFLDKKLLSLIKQHFKDCDLIVHAGDSTEMSVITELAKIAETKAVWGNMDGVSVRSSLPEKIIFKASGKNVGVVHGKGPADKLVEVVGKMFDKKMDIIIFGHSHVPCNEKMGGTLFFNPGSATDRVFAPYRSLGIINITDNNVSGEIIKLEDHPS